MSKTRAELARFALAGVAGLLVDVAVLYLALAAGLGYYGGRVLSFLAAVFVTWRLNRRYTFRPREDVSWWREWWSYLGAMLTGGVLNYAAYSGVVALLGDTRLSLAGVALTPMLAVAAGSVAGMSINYIGAKFVITGRPGARG